MTEPLIFLGAGASQPFSIPTMEGLVDKFSEELDNSGSPEEKNLYEDILWNVKKNYGWADLESVLSIIDELTNRDWITGFGSFSLLFYKRYLNSSSMPTLELSPEALSKWEIDFKVAQTLKGKMETFVRSECKIKEEKVYNKIYETYANFFQKLSEIFIERGRGHELISSKRGKPKRIHFSRCPIFTTNYDSCLEEFFRECEVLVNRGVEPDQARGLTIVDTRSLIRNPDKLSLAKLHGSLTWYRQEDGTIIEDTGKMQVGEKTYGTHRIIGEEMIYPIRQKEMYLDPYVAMMYFFAEKLRQSKIWIVIGYQFNDEILRTMFEDHSSKEKKMILVNPKAKEIQNKLELKSSIIPIEKKWGDPATTNDITDHFRVSL